MAGNIRVNYFFDAVSQVLAVLTPLITAPYLSRVFNADGIGTISFVNSIVRYFMLSAAMGIYTYGRREISYLQDDRAGRSRVFWNLKALALINVSVCMTAFLVLTHIYAGENYVLYVIHGMRITNALFDVNWVFAGMEDFRLIARRNIAVYMLNIALTFIFVKSRADIPVYLLLNVICMISGHITMYFSLPRYIDAPDIKNIRPFQGIKTIVSLFLPAVAIEVYTVLDKTMLGLFTPDSFENGYYESAQRISKISMMSMLSLSNVLIPRMGYLFEKNDIGKIHEYMYKSFRFVWFVGIPLCFGLIGISDNLVPWFLGEGYTKVSGLLKITSFLAIAMGFNNATGTQYLVPNRMHKYYMLTIFSGAVINFCMNLVFIPLFGSYGASFASVIAESVIALSQFYVLRKELSLRKIAASSRNYLIAGIIMLSVLVLMSKKLAPSAASTFAMILSGALVYFVVLVILRDDFFTENARKTLVSLKRKFHC